MFGRKKGRSDESESTPAKHVEANEQAPASFDGGPASVVPPSAAYPNAPGDAGSDVTIAAVTRMSVADAVYDTPAVTTTGATSTPVVATTRANGAPAVASSGVNGGRDVVSAEGSGMPVAASSGVSSIYPAAVSSPTASSTAGGAWASQVRSLTVERDGVAQAPHGEAAAVADRPAPVSRETTTTDSQSIEPQPSDVASVTASTVGAPATAGRPDAEHGAAETTDAASINEAEAGTSESWDDAITTGRSAAGAAAARGSENSTVSGGAAPVSSSEGHVLEAPASRFDSGSENPTTSNSMAEASVTEIDPDERRRAALVESLPEASDDTPLMAQLQQDARRRIELRGRRFPRPPTTRVVTVANQKGGVGKTTTTVNLAAALAQSGLNVLVLDNDPQGNASTAIGIEHRSGTPSIYEVLVDGAPMSEAVQESPDVPNLFCLPATIDLSGAEIELVSMVARETRLRNALDTYLTWRIDNGLEPIDYVFVDCPPSLGLLTVNAFVVAREVLIPIQCEYYALEGLSQLLKTIELIQAHLNPNLHVSTILLTMYDARTNLAQQVANEVRTHFPEITLRTTVPRSVRISEAPSYGQTVMTYDPGSTGALAYLEAAREVAERGAATGSSADETARDGATRAADARIPENDPQREQAGPADQNIDEPAMAVQQEEQ